MERSTGSSPGEGRYILSLSKSSGMTNEVEREKEKRHEGRMLGSHEIGEGALFPIPNEPLVPRGVISWIP